MHPIRSSPPLRHGFPRILATLSEEGNNNNNNNINNNNINDNNNNSDDPGSHYGRWSRVGCGNDNNGAKDDHHYSEHCGKDGYTSKSTSRHANQHQNWRQQQQQQQQPNLPPASRSDPSLSSTTTSNSTLSTSTSTTRFSFFQLWGRNRSSSTIPVPAPAPTPASTLPMRRAVSESTVIQESPSMLADQVLNDNLCTASMSKVTRRALITSMPAYSTLGPSMSATSPSVVSLDALRYAGSGEGGSRPEQQMRHANLKLASHTASSSSGTASSSSSNSTWPSSPDSSTDLMSGDANDYNRSSSSGNSSDECSNSLCLPMTTTLSRQQQALARVQERIVQGQGQLEHYHHLILGLEQERIEAIELWTGMKQERDTLGLEIEVLEQVLTSHSTSVAAGRHQSLFSNAVGYLWTVSTPSPLKRNAEMENVDNKAPAPCCSSDLQVSTPATAATTTAMAIATITGTDAKVATSPKPIGLPIVTAAATMEMAFVSPASSFSSMSSSSSVPSLPMCHRCRERAIVVDKRMRLNQIQGDVERMQQKIKFLGSQIKHIGRTFIAPIESCLVIDREEWTRLRRG